MWLEQKQKHMKKGRLNTQFPPDLQIKKKRRAKIHAWIQNSPHKFGGVRKCMNKNSIISVFFKFILDTFVMSFFESSKWLLFSSITTIIHGQPTEKTTNEMGG